MRRLVVVVIIAIALGMFAGAVGAMSGSMRAASRLGNQSGNRAGGQTGGHAHAVECLPMQQNKKRLNAQETAGLIVISAGAVILAIPFLAIWAAWGFGAALAALVMLGVGVWIGRR